jgi:hypothetical protein
VLLLQQILQPNIDSLIKDRIDVLFQVDALAIYPRRAWGPRRTSRARGPDLARLTLLATLTSGPGLTRIALLARRAYGPGFARRTRLSRRPWSAVHAFLATLTGIALLAALRALRDRVAQLSELLEHRIEKILDDSGYSFAESLRFTG